MCGVDVCMCIRTFVRAALVVARQEWLLGLLGRFAVLGSNKH